MNDEKKQLWTMTTEAVTALETVDLATISRWHPYENDRTLYDIRREACCEFSMIMCDLDGLDPDAPDKKGLDSLLRESVEILFRGLIGIPGMVWAAYEKDMPWIMRYESDERAVEIPVPKAYQQQDDAIGWHDQAIIDAGQCFIDFLACGKVPVFSGVECFSLIAKHDNRTPASVDSPYLTELISYIIELNRFANDSQKEPVITGKRLMTIAREIQF